MVKRLRASELSIQTAIGILSAVVLAGMVNLLSMRLPMRWDVTSSQLYTLSQPTLQTLASLSARVDILVFLPEADPQMGSVRQLLEQYRAESSQFHVQYVDPDRNPAEFVALQNQYRLSEGRAEQGHLVSDAALLVISGAERWIIPPESIVSYDEQNGTVKPKLEQSLTEGLRQVLHPQVTRACFSEGHGEPSLLDGGPQGLAAVAQMLGKNNYTTQSVRLGGTAAPLALSSCDLLVMVSPGRAFGIETVARVAAATDRGLNLLLAMGPSFGETNQTQTLGLEPLLRRFGMKWGQQLLFEKDAERALPLGLGGEVFLATPRPHAVTKGLLRGEEARMRVLLQLAQAVAPEPGAENTAVLLQTSDSAFGVSSAARSAEQLMPQSTGPFAVAMAAEMPNSTESTRGRPARLVALGSGSPLMSATWHDATLAGSRRFVESSISWLVSRPALVQLPDKPGRKSALRLTAGSMGRVARYVLLYLPLTALLLGALILFRRRSVKADKGSVSS